MQHYRDEFPILAELNRDRPLIYLDSSATSQKPKRVIRAIQHYYEHLNANVHRGVYELSEQATAAYERTRSRVQQHLNAKYSHEIIFVSGTTEAINLVAQSYGRLFQSGDEIIITEMEHHANIVPWQLLRDQNKIVLKVATITDSGELDLEKLGKLFSKRTRLLAVTHASNVLGTINPIKKICDIAHAKGVPVLVDGAQAFPHMAIDVQAMDCDFYAFSSHKAYGPTGLGVLYGKTNLLEKMLPYQGGGYMIESVTFEKTTFNQLPYKFEAGTPPIASVVAFHEALLFLEGIGMEAIEKQERDLLQYATKQLNLIPGLTIFGTAKEKLGVISFVLNNIHAHDVATILDHQGIAVRAGHHCAMPLMQRFKVPAMVRASFALYNTKEEIDVLVNGLQEALKVFNS